MSVSTPSRDDFAAMLEESFAKTDLAEGYVTKGIITAIEKDVAIVDVGLKVEGRIALKEFGAKAKDGSLKVGDEVEVYVERIENALGEAVLSREKARREESWIKLEAKFEAGERVEGVIFNQVKGGFTVDLDGAVAFLPRSQVDIRPIRDVTPLMHNPQPFEILKMDKRRGNIVVSRRTVLEESRAEQRSEIVQNLEEGQVVDGVVKNITDYGAFVELEAGIEGLVHVSEMSWTKKNVHPGKLVSTSQEVEVMVLDVDREKRRISLGLKQTQDNPWNSFAADHKNGEILEGEIRNITEFGLFVALPGDLDGMVHMSDISWEGTAEEALKAYNKGDVVKVKILEIEADKERVALGIKQLTENPNPNAPAASSSSSSSASSASASSDNVSKNAVVTCTITEINDKGIEVSVGDKKGFIKKSDLSRERSEQRPDRFAVGEKVDAKVLSVEKGGKLNLSIKQREMDEDKAAMAEFGSTESGASLGDILGAALKQSGGSEAEKPAAKAKKKKEDEAE